MSIRLVVINILRDSTFSPSIHEFLINFLYISLSDLKAHILINYSCALHVMTEGYRLEAVNQTVTKLDSKKSLEGTDFRRLRIA